MLDRSGRPPAAVPTMLAVTARCGPRCLQGRHAAASNRPGSRHERDDPARPSCRRRPTEPVCRRVFPRRLRRGQHGWRHGPLCGERLQPVTAGGGDHRSARPRAAGRGTGIGRVGAVGRLRPPARLRRAGGGRCRDVAGTEALLCRPHLAWPRHRTGADASDDRGAATRGARSLWLGVWEHNPRAVAFYGKYGFRRVGQHTFVLGGDAQTDWLMECTLGDARPDGPAASAPA